MVYDLSTVPVHSDIIPFIHRFGLGYDAMVLVTGATGFVGRTVIRYLAASGYPVRCLVRNNMSGLRLPRDLTVFVTAGSLSDTEVIRNALLGVETVIHLASADWQGLETGLIDVDHAGSRELLKVAVEANVRRIVYLSHLGADRASAFSVHKIKGIVEEFIRRSGIPHTIIRSALLYGEEDSFTNAAAALLRVVPVVCPLPGSGQVLLQPLWVGDLATCIVRSLADDSLVNRTISVGGPEFLSLASVAHLIMQQIGVRRIIMGTPHPYLRWMVQRLRPLLSNSPLTTHWLDHVAVNRTCEVNSMPRYFDIKPAVFEHTIGYLTKGKWRSDLDLLLGRSSMELVKSRESLKPKS